MSSDVKNGSNGASEISDDLSLDKSKSDVAKKAENQSDKNVLILGIGNLLWADEGFGVRCVEELHKQYQFSENVTLLDGGTQGIYLVQHIRETDILVVFDAVDYGLEPGTMKIVHDDEVPKFLGIKKISLHQTGFQEVLAMAEMLGDYPEKLLLIGVQPVELDDFGGGLRDKVKQQIPNAIEEVLKYLKTLGISASKRDKALTDEETIGCTVMVQEKYEDDRPNEDTAYRKGDIRFMNNL